ncbi:MAG: dipeptide ABC transporter ATP-binding protein [Aestuariivita sp.]|nr:dipeptide ABC transporter ATP-binding protein [Aestuariivita sp.]
MNILEIENLCLSIHQTSILDNISLSLEVGNIHAITGESGAGKSMVACSIMQLFPNGTHVSGQIKFNGENLLMQTERQMCAIRGNKIGMVFQEPMTALNPVKTIGAQVAETIRIHKAISREAANTSALNLLARVGLPQNRFPISLYPHQLSGGQRQRVVIAIAIALRPKLLIADEPTTALDVTTQAKILNLLKDLVTENQMAMLMISHDLTVVANLANHITVMKSGKIVESAKTHHLLSHMGHNYTKKLFFASRHIVQLPKYTSSDTLLRVQNVSKDYQLPRTRLFKAGTKFRALNDISFQLHKGERLGLVGESGCGKSTLVRAILGLNPVDNGNILLEDEPVFRANRPNFSIRHKMQVVFQDPFSSFNPRHRIDRLISEPFHLLPKSLSDRKRHDILSTALTAVGLRPEDAQKYIHEFSGGQRQRIAIARAIVMQPELILFDEAVSALDVSVKATILDLLADLCHQYNLTYLFISHDLSVVRSVTDRVLVMKDGKIVERGQTDRVLSKPTHPYTKELISAAPQLPNFDKF